MKDLAESEVTKMESTLTEKEQIECTVKWLNALYGAWIKKEEVKIPCAECRHFGKECSKNDPPQANFKVLEQYTGEGSVISFLIN